ncbi:MAG TPA: amino acid racemase [Candidatus Bathyarchaeia archaeon]|nr:amino acid racemase [Candidatus Bathyarchaeia archaeon]
MKSKLIGIIGGIGPESTIDYYRLFVSIYRERRPDGYPPVISNSIDLAKVLQLVGANDLAGLTAYLLEEIHRLARAGATHGVLSSNTPHIVFDELEDSSPIPLISIVETACRAAAERKLKRAGLFGTRFTMQGGFYQKVFAREGIEIAIPESGDQKFIHDTYLNELVNGIVRTETRERYIAIARKLKAEQGIEALILGGTELPLLLRGAIDIGVMLLDTAHLHVERAVAEMLA